MLPSPSDLRYFVEIAQTKNLSRAAEKLGVSQPSLTIAMKRLEDSVGTMLLLRNKKGVDLTQAGKQLLLHSRELIQKWDDVKSSALASHTEVSGQFTLGCHPSVALYCLGFFLPDLLEDFPKLEIKLKHDLSRKITEGVIAMEIDIGIVVNPVQHPDLIIQKLFDDEVTLFVGPGDYRIQNWKDQKAILICDTELLQTQDLLRKIKDSNIHYERVLPSSSLEVITSLIASGCGIGILPSRVAKYASVPLKKIKNAPVFSDEICIVYRMENKGLPAIQMLIERIRKGMKD